MTAQLGMDEPHALQGVGLLQILAELRRSVLFYSAFALVGLVGAIVAVLVWPRTYRVEVLVQPIAQSAQGGNLAAMAASLGGLASVAGLLGGNDDSQAAIATLGSRSLTEEYISKNDLLPVLFSERWDRRAHRWIDAREPKIPSLWDGYRMFDRRIRSVKEDRRTGLVALSIDWRDAAEAAKWANGLIVLANERIRARAIHDSTERVELLTAEAKEASVEIKTVIYRLIEAEIQRVTIARADSQFAFKVIDAAAPPDADAFVKPKRVMWPLLGLIFGMAVAAGVAVLNLLRVPQRAAG